MSSSSSSSSSGGIGVAGLLGVAFVVLKLCGVINWPWLWVLSPFWIPLAMVLVFLLVVGLVLAIAAVTSDKPSRRSGSPWARR